MAGEVSGLLDAWASSPNSAARGVGGPVRLSPTPPAARPAAPPRASLAPRQPRLARDVARAMMLVDGLDSPRLTAILPLAEHWSTWDDASWPLAPMASG